MKEGPPKCYMNLTLPCNKKCLFGKTMREVFSTESRELIFNSSVPDQIQISTITFELAQDFGFAEACDNVANEAGLKINKDQ